jgi:hypothetical protein
VPIAVHELNEVVPQLVPLKASINVLLVVKLFPPAAIDAISILTDVQPAGVVKVYHTSYIVPAHDPAMPELVARYKVPVVFTQVVPGVRDVGVAQLSDCAINIFETIVKIKTSTPVRVVLVIGSMVFQGF